MLAVALLGVPWYFLRNRGFIGALKAAFGFGLFLVGWLGVLIAFAIGEGITASLAS